MINPLPWVKSHAALTAGAAGVVGLGLLHKHKSAGGSSASSNGASYGGGTTDTPAVQRGGIPTYDSSGQDQTNALLDIDTRLAYLGDQVAALDPATASHTPSTVPIAKATPVAAKPKPRPRPKPVAHPTHPKPAKPPVKAKAKPVVWKRR